MKANRSAVKLVKHWRNNRQLQYHSYLVNYNTINFKNYRIYSKNVLVINIGRCGLKELANKIIQQPFNQIIYIGCHDKTIQKDMQILSKVYTIDKILKIDQFPQPHIKQVKKNFYSYIINLLRIDSCNL